MGLKARTAGKSDRISCDVTDIGSANQLLSYALAGQLERLRKQRGDISQGRVAEAARLGSKERSAGPVLSHALRNGPTVEQLHKLDEIIGALSSDMDGIGGLTSLSARVSAERHGKVTPAHVPPSWTASLLRGSPSSEFEVLTQASALLSAFAAAERMDTRSISAVRERYATEMKILLRRLILISVSPPTSWSYDAQIMLGSLASYAFELTRDRLELAVRNSPLSFRVWRAITKQVKLKQDGEPSSDLRAWVRQLVRVSGVLRGRSVYPGGSLDLELALAVPAAWSPPENDWVGEVLRARAWDREVTLRERSTAAMGLWQRAIEQGRNLKETEIHLRELIAELKDPESRPDAPAATRWLATTLEHVIEKQEPICNEWPDVDEPWFRRVMQAADELLDFGVPDHLLDGTRHLFLHMILQNAGGYRRQAIETIVTSGLATPFARALGAFLKNETEETWVRMRAESALGLLQKPNQWVEEDLTQACQSSYGKLVANLAANQWVPRAQITELHTALFAVGDCFGALGADERAESARDGLRQVLTALADAEGDRATLLRRPARAAAYLLTVTAQPKKNGKTDLSEVLLDKMKSHPDDVTAQLSKWALSFRFSPDGTVRPLLDAAVHGVDDTVRTSDLGF